MKLKQIPRNTVVHTPAEEDVRELLGILRENGWITNGCTNYAIKNAEGIQIDSETDWSWWEKIESARKENLTIISPAEFKERYVDTCTNDCSSTVQVEKPQPKFNKGQWVRITNKKHPHFGHKGKVGEVISYDPEYDRYRINGIPSVWESGDLEPYTEPETKEETMETKELNLCELLKGHEGETFYLLMYGEVEYKGIDKDGFIAFTDSKIPTIYDDGKYDQHANVVLFPSRALYEQYPLDPLKAWMKWQEEQKKHWVAVTAWIDDLECESDTAIDTDKIYFRTSEDRDKCIEEIKAIINKYSK